MQILAWHTQLSFPILAVMQLLPFAGLFILRFAGKRSAALSALVITSIEMLLAIYLLVDIFERLDNFIEAKKPLSLALKYFILKIPAIAEQLMPVCILLGGVITLGLLNHHYELIALKAGGINILRITAPLIGGGLLFTLLIMAGGQWLLPITNATVNRIWYEEVRDQTPKGIYRDGNFYIFST